MLWFSIYCYICSNHRCSVDGVCFIDLSKTWKIYLYLYLAYWSKIITREYNVNRIFWIKSWQYCCQSFFIIKNLCLWLYLGPDHVNWKNGAQKHFTINITCTESCTLSKHNCKHHKSLSEWPGNLCDIFPIAHDSALIVIEFFFLQWNRARVRGFATMYKVSYKLIHLSLIQRIVIQRI